MQTLFRQFKSGHRERARSRRSRFLRSLHGEQLESRQLLDATTSILRLAPTASWFETVSERSRIGLSEASTGIRAATGAPFDAYQAENASASRWIVQLTPAATAQAADPNGAASLLNGIDTSLTVVRGLGQPGLILIDVAQVPVATARAALAAHANVAYSELDVSLAADAIPNDPSFALQTGFHNLGGPSASLDADVDAPEAWELTTGSSDVVVAVIDTGIDLNHPDLAANLFVNAGETPNDGIDNDHNGFIDDVQGWDFLHNDAVPQDDQGHGTHVAGTIAAVGDNGLGVAGVTWRSKILPIKFLDEHNQGNTSDAVRAVNYVTLLKSAGVNIRVVNASWGSSVYSPALDDAIAAGAAEGILYIAASGNGDVLGRGIDNDQQPFYPASLDSDYVLSVAAAGPNDELARFSNYGAGTVDLAAPGVGVLSTDLGGGYVSRNGTSMAAPHVSGVAALVAAFRPDATALDLRTAILRGVDPVAGLAEKTVTGGRLNARRSLIVDGSAPRFVSSTVLPSMTSEVPASAQFTVAYTDDVAISVATLDASDVVAIRVDDPARMATATLLSRSHLNDGTTRSATYRLLGPDGRWDFADNGEWELRLQEQQVGDTSGNFAAGVSLGRFMVLVPPPPPPDPIIYVNSTADTVDAHPGDGVAADESGFTTLRAAIMESNALPGVQTIVLPAGTFPIARTGNDGASVDVTGRVGDLDVTDSLVIRGDGSGSTVVDGNQIGRIFDVANAKSLELSDVSLINGFARDLDGGAIATTGPLTIQRVRFASNVAIRSGGAIATSGATLTIRDSVFEHNEARGGAGAVMVWDGVQGVIAGSQFINNQSVALDGGALVTRAATVEVTDSLFDNNRTGRIASAIEVDSFAGVMTLRRVVVTNNFAGNTAIYNSGTLNIHDSRISDNIAASGITSTATLNLYNTTVSGNRASSGGGGLTITDKALIVNSAIVNNNSASGGGILVSGATSDVTLDNSTISGNSVSTSGGGIMVSSGGGHLALFNSTVVDNHADSIDRGGIYLGNFATATLRNSIVAQNTGGYQNPDIAGTFISQGHNLIGTFSPEATGFTNGINGDLVGTTASRLDPRLGPLRDNGGPTPSHAPLSGSPAIDAGDTAGIRGTDQRAFTRLADGDHDGLATVDIGAVEFGTFYVNNTTDTPDANPGDGIVADASGRATLRAAIQEANAILGANTIVLAPGEYRLSRAGTNEDAAATGDLDVLDDLTMLGAGATVTLIDAQGLDRVFQVPNGVAFGVTGVTLVGGNASTDGGAVLNAGTITLQDSVLTGNAATTNGGAVRNTGTAMLTRVTIDHNTTGGAGGGISNSGTVNLIASTLHHNTAASDGGGVHNSGTFTAENSTLSTNSATNGGGLASSGGTVLLRNATVTANSANHSGGGGVASAGTPSLQNTIVAANFAATADPDLNGQFTSLGGNLIGILGSATGIVAGVQSDQAGTGTVPLDPRLVPLQFPANSPPWHPLRYGSPAIDRGLRLGAPTIDQRGLSRPQDGDDNGTDEVDVGAYEFSLDETASIGGQVFFDLDQDGVLDADESLLANWTVYLDLNQDGTWDAGEPSTITNDDPATLTVDEAGTYLFARVDPGTYQVRVVTKPDWTPTPDPPGVSLQTVALSGGTVAAHVDFGAFTTSGSIRGIEYNDRNGNGRQDPGELGLANWQIFVDLNRNGRLEGNEPFAVTDENGHYFLSDLPPLDNLMVAELPQAGWEGTQPTRSFQLDAGTTLTVGDDPRQVVVSYLNSDDFPDLAVVDAGSGDVRILLGQGNGSFSASASYVVGTGPRSLATADLDGDGDVDLFVVNRGSDSISILLNNGAGHFQSGGQITTDDQPIEVAAVRLNSDAYLDLVVLHDGASSEPNRLSVLLGSGIGTFGAPARYAVGSSPRALLVSDLDGDATLDVAVASRDTDELVLRLNDGNGELADPLALAVGDGPLAVAAADFNGDGRMDLVVASANSDSVSILVNQGDHRFTLASPFLVGDTPQSVGVGDLDGDGRADLFTVNGDNSLTVLRNTGLISSAATFARADWPLSAASQMASAADFNGDGRLDLALAQPAADRVMLLNNATLGRSYMVDLGTTRDVRDIDFGNRALPARIHGSFFQDSNANGQRDAGEGVAAGVTVYLDQNQNGQFDETGPDAELSTLTDAHGSYVFSNLDPFNTYYVAQVAPPGFKQTTPRTPFGFAAKTDYATGSGSSGVAVGDLNGDTFPDMAVTNANADSVSVLIGRRDGTFADALTWATGDSPHAPALADIDGDGDRDLLWVNAGAGELVATLNPGDGRYSAINTITLLAAVDALAVVAADFDGDGDVDLVVTRTGGLTVLENLGSGVFAAPLAISGPRADQAVAADWDVDGDLDLATLDATQGRVSIFTNRGDGAFSEPVTHTVGGAPLQLAAADLDGDGDLDLVTDEATLENRGNGSFDSPVALESDVSTGRSLAIADLDDDGDIDIALAQLDRDDMVAFLNDGRGGFAESLSFAVGDGPAAIAAADFNQDGSPDVVTAGQNTGRVSVLLNTLRPTTAAVTPTAGAAIAGVDFGNRPLGGVGGAGIDGAIRGSAFQDTNRNGRQDPGEPGQAGRTLYLDLNRNGVLDVAEPMTVSRTDDPATALVDETGWYAFTQLTPNTYIVRQVDPVGEIRTTPLGVSLARTDLATGNGPRYVVTTDFDRDGDRDLVVSNGVTNTLSLLRNVSGGGYETASTIRVGAGPWSIVAADFNGDGREDLAVLHEFSSSVGVLLNNGSGYGTMKTVPVGLIPAAIVVGDWNGDGTLDLAVANEKSANIVLLANDGAGQFTELRKWTVDSNPRALAAEDFDGDGDTDLVVASFDSLRATLWRNDGTGRFAAAATAPTGMGSFAMAAADFDSDGDADVAIANLRSDNVSILLNRGDGSFEASVATAGKGPASLVASDLDGDGDVDLAVSNGTTVNLTLLLNNGHGQFTAGETAGVANFQVSLPLSVTADDLNGDSVPDLAVVDGYRDRLSVLLSTPQPGAYIVTVTAADQFAGLDFGSRRPNEPPTDILLSNLRVAEDADTITGPYRVGQFTALDADTPTSGLTYALVAGTGATDNSRFRIIGDFLQFAAGPRLDHEFQATYSIRIQATDGVDALEKVFSIQVTDVNEPPSNLGLSAGVVTENIDTTAGPVVIGTISAIDPDASAMLTYSLVSGTGSTDNHLFQVAGETLQLRTGVIVDYERQANFSVRVRVTDGALSVERVFSIPVADVNEPPDGLVLASDQVAENSATIGPLSVGRLVGSDPDAGASLSYLLIGGEGDADNGLFQIAGDQLQFRAGVPLDHESRASYSVRVQATDGRSSLARTFVVRVTDVNEPPAGLVLSSNSLPEDTSTSTAVTVGRLSASDPDAGTVLVYSLVPGFGAADNAVFQISGNQLQFRAGAILDFESQTTYSARVQVSDGQLTQQVPFEVHVTDVNEAPFGFSLVGDTVPENVDASAGSVLVGTFTAQDPDAGATLAVSLVAGIGATDNGRFQLNGLSLSLRAGVRVDFEEQPSYSIRVRLSDGSNQIERPFVIHISDVNEPPFGLRLSNLQVSENLATAGGLTVGSLSADDPDGGTALAYELVTGGGDADNGNFLIQGSLLKLAPGVVLDYETQSEYHVRVRVSDGLLAAARAFTVVVADINEPPSNLRLTNSQVLENTNTSAGAVTIGRLRADDVDASSVITYALVSGTGSTDNRDFVLDGDLLRVKPGVILDFESRPAFTVLVRATDGELAIQRALAIQVTDVNEPPTNLRLSNDSVPENTQTTTAALVGTVVAVDPDAGSTLTYALVPGDGAADNRLFQILGNTLSFRAGTSLDFETQAEYSIRLQVSDGSLVMEQPLFVNVTDVDEAPFGFALSNNTIAEDLDTAEPAVVGTFSAQDPDANATLVYSVVSGLGDTDNGRFEVAGTALKIVSGTKLDFETQASYSVRVRVTDGSHVVERAFTIQVTDVVETPENRLPVAGNDDGGSTDEDTLLAGTAPGLLRNDTDEDAGDTLTVSRFDTASRLGAAVTVAADGAWTYDPSQVTEFQVLSARQSLTDDFTYTVDDGHGGTSSATVTITVRGVNDWENARDADDVNHDGVVTSIDALVIINEINTNGTRGLPGRVGAPSKSYDANGDNNLSPADALKVINRLNAAQGEGVTRTPVRFSPTVDWGAFAASWEANSRDDSESDWLDLLAADETRSS